MADRFVVAVFECFWFLPEPVTFMIAFFLWLSFGLALVYATTCSFEWAVGRLLHDR